VNNDISTINISGGKINIIKLQIKPGFIKPGLKYNRNLLNERYKPGL
jgi:hypothetical protein